MRYILKCIFTCTVGKIGILFLFLFVCVRCKKEICFPLAGGAGRANATPQQDFLFQPGLPNSSELTEHFPLPWWEDGPSAWLTSQKERKKRSQLPIQQLQRQRNSTSLELIYCPSQIQEEILKHKHWKSLILFLSLPPFLSNTLSSPHTPSFPSQRQALGTFFAFSSQQYVSVHLNRQAYPWCLPGISELEITQEILFLIQTWKKCLLFSLQLWSHDLLQICCNHTTVTSFKCLLLKSQHSQIPLISFQEKIIEGCRKRATLCNDFQH